MPNYKVAGTTTGGRITARPVDSNEVYATQLFDAGSFELTFTAPAAVDTLISCFDGSSVKNTMESPVEVV